MNVPQNWDWLKKASYLDHVLICSIKKGMWVYTWVHDLSIFVCVCVPSMTGGYGVQTTGIVLHLTYLDLYFWKLDYCSYRFNRSNDTAQHHASSYFVLKTTSFLSQWTTCSDLIFSIETNCGSLLLPHHQGLAWKMFDLTAVSPFCYSLDTVYAAHNFVLCLLWGKPKGHFPSCCTNILFDIWTMSMASCIGL